ncbi:MAG TPA: hypothetical protein VFS20_13070 [Longimicrobium sp.]|nr:hypothetical protein [Longimicrobium sp.]
MEYGRNVFINCPFDVEYQPLFRAVVFAVLDYGLYPPCALERDDGSEVRIEKIRRIVAESQFAIHDISRTELDDETGLPRFNMPFELGIFMGAKWFGGDEHQRKSCVIFDRERYRYQAFCSDIAGQDIRAHRCEEREVIRGVRNALRTWCPERELPGAAVTFERYLRFDAALMQLADRMGLDANDLSFSDFTSLVGEWLRVNTPAPVAVAA